MPKQRTTYSRLELIAEVGDLAAGLGIITFVLFPMALPALALIALVAVLLLIPPVIGAALAAPILAIRHWQRSRGTAKPAIRSPATRHANRGRSGAQAHVSPSM